MSSAQYSPDFPSRFITRSCIKGTLSTIKQNIASRWGTDDFIYYVLFCTTGLFSPACLLGQSSAGLIGCVNVWAEKSSPGPSQFRGICPLTAVNPRAILRHWECKISVWALALIVSASGQSWELVCGRHAGFARAGPLIFWKTGWLRAETSTQVS